MKTESDGGSAVDRNGKVLLVGDTVRVRERWRSTDACYSTGTLITVGTNHCGVSYSNRSGSYFAFRADTTRWEPEDRV